MYDGPIVCDSGPLIALAMVGQLGLLPELYSRVVAPAAVLREIVESGAGRLGAREVAEATWLEQVDDEVLPEPLLALELGPGEAAVIAVASRLRAPLVLVDELRARRIAERAYSLRVKLYRCPGGGKACWSDPGGPTASGIHGRAGVFPLSAAHRTGLP